MELLKLNFSAYSDTSAESADYNIHITRRDELIILRYLVMLANSIYIFFHIHIHTQNHIHLCGLVHVFTSFSREEILVCRLVCLVG
jgi:hypothetical protein